jgi:hypothetical protein
MLEYWSKGRNQFPMLPHSTPFRRDTGTMNILSLQICDRNITVTSDNSEVGHLLRANYAEAEAQFATPDLKYTVGRERDSGEFYILRESREPLRTKLDGQFLQLFQKEITLRLKELRRDLYFIHSAVLEYQGKACLLIGRSKSGKSTTTWALLHHGFRYLSDELAPVNPETLHVHPYPRAIWLRPGSPAAQHSGRKIHTSWWLCIPPGEFAGRAVAKPIPLGAVFFVRYSAESRYPSLRPVSRPTAVAQILERALNPGAHSGNGLDAAVEIATRIRCHELVTAALPETCAIVRDALMESV